MDKIKNFLFKNNNTRQILIKNSFWFALGTAITKIARALIIIYVAKILGADQYGIFTYALSLVGIFMIFADLGITSILTRELTKDTPSKSEFFSTAFFVKTSFLLGTIILSVIFGPLISKFKEAIPLITLIAVFVATESMRSFLYSITRAQNKMQTEAGLGIVTEIISVVLILFLFTKDPSVHSLTKAFIFGNLIGLAITITFLRKNLVGLLKNFKPELVKSIIKSSWPFAIMGIFGVFMTNIDSVMIAFWNNPTVLGLYAAAQKPISLLYVIPSFLSISLFPFISRIISDSRKDTGNIIEKSSRLSFAVALPIVLGGIMLAGPLLRVTFGDEYIGAMLTFQILLLTLIPAFPGAVFSDVIVAEDRQKVFIKSTAFGAMTNVILNFILIPKYGITGSAMATLVAQIVMNSILYMKVKKSFNINIIKGLGKILIASISIIPITYILKTWSTPLIIIIPLSAIVYIGILIFTKEEIITEIKKSFNV